GRTRPKRQRRRGAGGLAPPGRSTYSPAPDATRTRPRRPRGQAGARAAPRPARPRGARRRALGGRSLPRPARSARRRSERLQRRRQQRDRDGHALVPAQPRNRGGGLGRRRRRRRVRRSRLRSPLAGSPGGHGQRQTRARPEPPLRPDAGRTREGRPSRSAGRPERPGVRRRPAAVRTGAPGLPRRSESQRHPLLRRRGDGGHPRHARVLTVAPTPRRRPGTVRFGDLEVSVQTTVLAAGAIVWLGIVVANTGGSGVAATWTNASFPALLLVATGLVRSIRTRLTVRLFLLGGLMLSIALVGAWGFERVVSDPGATSRDVVVPLMEETLKLAPLLYLLWRWRRRRAQALGASDVLVMAAAVGAGFALVEDAFIREAVGWARTLPLLPATEYAANGFGERLIVGHAMWTALAGATMGLALLLVCLTLRGFVIGLSGYAVSALDHMANNLSNGGHARLLNDLML